MSAKSAVLYFRVAPQLRTALSLAAESAGVSMNAYAIHVLASAVAPQLHQLNADLTDGTTAVPDSVPLTTQDHERAMRLRQAEVRAATARWVDRHIGTPELRRRWRMTDDEFLEWYRREDLPFSADPERFIFRRGA